MVFLPRIQIRKFERHYQGPVQRVVLIGFGHFEKDLRRQLTLCDSIPADGDNASITQRLEAMSLEWEG